MKKFLPFISMFSVLALAGAGCFQAETKTDVGVNAEVGDEDENEERNEDEQMEEDEDTDEDEEGEENDVEIETVVLSEQNDSNESGSVTLQEKDGKTTVVITLSNQPEGVAQPAHIHAGTCASIGAVVYPLTLVVDGRSETVFDLPLTTMLSAATDLSINVHMSELDLGTYVACGDIDA